MSNRGRKFYKVDKDGISKSYRGFLLKWIDYDSEEIKIEGPYTDKNEADEQLSAYLKIGICSWLVKYDD